MMTKIVDSFGNELQSEQKAASTVTTTVTVANDKLEPDEILFIQTPIFLLFGEYLGYVSSFIEDAESWCDPKKPMPKPFMKTLLEREARSIYDGMLKDYTEEEIHSLYVTYYPLGLDELDADLKDKRKAAGDDLPF